MVSDYLAGSLALLLVVAPWGIAAPRLARRVLVDWHGAELALAASIVGVSGVLVVSELCGIAGGFSRWTVAIANLVVGSAAAALGQGSSERWRPALPREPQRRLALGAATVSTCAVSAAFLARDARALRTGPNDDDSLHYHLSTAALFVQTHSIDHLHFLAASDVSAYYPFNGELIQAIGMLGPRPDLAVFAINLLFALMMLLACWVIGSRWGVAEAATAAGAVVLCLPIVAAASSGAGLTDVPTVSAFLAAVGLLVAAGPARGQRSGSTWGRAMFVAGLALGLAAGSKLSTLPPVAMVALALLVVVAGDRRIYAVAVTSGALLTGLFWYARDWIEAGSPIPGINLTVAGHGLHAVSIPETRPDAFSVAHYLGNAHVVRHWFIPDLRVVWSPLWPVIAVLVVVSVIAALGVATDPVRRLLAVVVILGFVVYVATPSTALGPPGEPVLFGTNTRYVLPVLALAVVLLVTAEPLRRHSHWVGSGLTVLSLILLGTEKHQLSSQLAWPRGAAAAAIMVLVAAVLHVAAGRSSRAAIGTGVVLILAGTAAGLGVQHYYLRDRYAGPDPRDRLFALGNEVSHVRIGVVGDPLQYPFFGPSLSNQVSYVGERLPDGSFGAPRTCLAWQTELARSGDRYLVIEPLAAEQTDSLLSWTLDLPGTRVLQHGPAGVVVGLEPAITPAGCS